jgi:hypothetical protein
MSQFQKIRLALLICDTPLPQVVAVHGDYHRIFNALLTESRPKNAPHFILDPYDVVHKQEYPQGSYDGIIITGSASSAYVDVPWINKLVEYVADVANNKPHIKIIGKAKLSFYRIWTIMAALSGRGQVQESCLSYGAFEKFFLLPNFA